MDLTLRLLISDVFRKSKKSRAEIADEMSHLTGRRITEQMLNCYSAESKETHRFPAAFIPAFCAATGDHRVLNCLAEVLGLHLVDRSGALLMELGSRCLEKEEADVNFEAIKRQIRSGKR